MQNFAVFDHAMEVNGVHKIFHCIDQKRKKRKRLTIPLRTCLQCEDCWEECHKNSSEEFMSQREGDTIVMRKPELCITCIVKWAEEKWHYC